MGRQRVGTLAETVHHDEHSIVSLLVLRRETEEVHGPVLASCVRHLQGREKPWRLIVRRRGPSAWSARRTIGADVLFHPRPPIPLFHEADCLVSAGVRGLQRVVSFAGYPCPEQVLVGY